MQIIHRFSVNGELCTVPENDLDEFFSRMEELGCDVQEISTYDNGNGNRIDVPTENDEEYHNDLANVGATSRGLTSVQMDDGEILDLDDESLRQFVQARRQGMPMSRGLLANTGIPDWYGKSREDREAIADEFSQMFDFGDDAPDVQSGRDENFGDMLTSAAESVAESPAGAAVKGFGEGLARSVTEPQELWDETYGEDSVAANALAGANDFANKLGKKIMNLNPAAKEVVAQAIGGEDTEWGRALRENAAADRETIDKTLPTDTAHVDDSLKGANEFVGDTLATIGTFAIPGAAAVDISANTANAYYDAYERAVKNGATPEKAEALAAAKSGATAAMGLVLGKAAQGARSAAGFKGALADMAVTGGEMGGLAGAEDVIEQGIEGAENPDWERTGKTVAEETAKGAAFSGISRLAHGAADSGNRELEAESARTRQRMEEEAAKTEREIAARGQYESRMSEETLNDIDTSVNEMIKSEVIPSYRQAEEVRQKAIEKLGTRDAGESHEAVEQAVMEAAQEVQGRLQTPERVTSPALERRQTEAEMRNNERWAKRGEELEAEVAKDEAAKKLAEEQEAAKREVAAEEVAQGEHEARQNDLDAAFADYDAALAEREAALKKGNPVKGEAQTPDPIMEVALGDAVLQKIDAAYKKAKTQAERNAIQEQFKARVNELREQMKPEEVKPTDEAPVEPAEPVAEKPVEPTAEEKSVVETPENDAGFRAWAVDRKGNPIEFETPEEEARSRELFNQLVKAGKVDPQTGETKLPDMPEVDETPIAQKPPEKPVEKPTEEPAPTGEEAKPNAPTAKDDALIAATKVLGTDAYLPKDSLQKKLSTWKKNVNNFSGERKDKLQKQIEAAEQVLAAKEAAAPVEKTPVAAPAPLPKSQDQKDGGQRSENPNESTAGQMVEADSVENVGGFKITGSKKTARTKAAADEVNAAIQKRDELEKERKNVLKKYDEDKYMPPVERQKLKDQYYSLERQVKSANRAIDDAMRKMNDRNYEPSSELMQEQSRIDSMPEFNQREKNAKKKAQKSWLLKAVDEAIGESGDGKGDLLAEKAQLEAEWKEKEGKKYARQRINDISKRIDDIDRELIGQERIVFNVPDDGTFTIANTPYALKTFKSLVQKRLNPTALKESTIKTAERPLADDVKSAGIGEKVSRPTAKPTPQQRTDMHRNDPRLLSDPKVIAWAKDNGRTVIDGQVTPDARREYDAQQADKAGKLVKNWFPDMKITSHEHGENIRRGQHVIELRDTAEGTIGWFDPTSKEVHLLPGANAETVAHEIMWHGTRDWAKNQAANGNSEAQRLLNKMHEVENNVSPALRTKVLRLYRANGVSNRDTLLNEFGAWDSMVNGGKALEDVISTREGQQFYAKWMTTAKDLVKEFLSKRGMNRVDLSQIDGMTTDEFKEFLSQQFAGGKHLGKIGASQGTGQELSTNETLWQKARRKVYDSAAAVRDMERDIEKKTGNKISTDDSADAALALLPGLREAAAINQKKIIRETAEMLKKKGISQEDLDYYMGNIAAPGRDAKVDNRNLKELREKVEAKVRAEWGTERVNADPAAFQAEVDRRYNDESAAYVPVNASHIDPREAASQTRRIKGSSKATEFADAKAEMDKIQKDTMDTLVRSGLVAQRRADELRAEEPDYVPFKSEFNEEGEFVGRGNNDFSNDTFHRAEGRKSSAGSITAHIINDNAQAHIRGAENEAREKLARLVEANPELGTVEKLGNSSDKEARRGKSGDEYKKNVVIFKRKGENYIIRLKGERGEAIAAAYTKVNQRNMPQWAQKISRAWAATATEWSPTFAVRNFTKDNIELANIVYSEKGLVKGTEFAARYLKNQATSAATLIKYITRGKIDTSDPVGKMFQEFIDNGGMIGGYGTEGYTDIAKALSSKRIAKELKRGNSLGKTIAGDVLHSVSYLNKFSELASRFNAERTQVEMGMDPKEATLWSRRALTDFNRKGDLTGWTNVAYMFSKSTMGATARGMTALAKSKYGWGMAAACTATGIAQTVIEHYMNADADEENKKLGKGTGKDVNEFTRRNSLWFVRDGKNQKEYSVKAHQSALQQFNYLGMCIGRVAMGDMTPEEAAKNLGISVTEFATMLLTPTGGLSLPDKDADLTEAGKTMINTLCPTIFRIVTEPSLNLDYAGRTIYNEAYDKNDPKFKRARASTPEVFVEASKWLNEKSGGNDAVGGKINVPPEILKYVTESVGKNAAKDVVNAYTTGMAIINGDIGSLEDSKIPFKRDFVRDSADNTSEFYKAKNDFDWAKKDFDKRPEWKEGERSQYLKDHPYLRKNGMGHRQLDWLTDTQTTERPRSNVGQMGINQLRKLEQGYIAIKTPDGTIKYAKPKNTPITDEEKERAKAERLRKQAVFLKKMGK